MGFLDVLFGKRVFCERCHTKTKAKEAVKKRGRFFCSDDCRNQWSKANPPPKATGGDPASYREKGLELLKLAQDYMGIVLKVSGGKTMSGTNIISINVAAADARDAYSLTQSNLMKYEREALESLSYLYALGLTENAEALESFDFQPIYEMSVVGAGPLQQKRVRKMVTPAFEWINKTIDALDGMAGSTLLL